MSDKYTTYYTSTKPTALKLKAYRVFYFLFGWVGRLYFSLFFNHVKVEGLEHLKGGGAKLLVMNHSMPLDPVIITFFGRQPLQFLITEPAMRGGFNSILASTFGQITKRKFDFEMSSIKLLKEWNDLGAITALFPEGMFPLYEKRCNLMQGIDQLIKYLSVPVVAVNLQNGDKVKPWWAINNRKTSIKIKIHPPKTFVQGEDITKYIEDHIFESKASSFEAYGDNLVYGLKEKLMFCPHCSSVNLRESRNTLFCIDCDSSWEVHADNTITHSEDSEVGDLFQKVYKILDSKWDEFSNFNYFNQVEAIDMTKKNWVKLSEAQLIVTKEGIQVGEWTLPFSEIVDHTLDWDNMVLIRSKRKRIGIRFNEDSRMIFAYLLDKGIGRPFSYILSK